MKKFELLAASAVALIVAAPAYAQTAPSTTASEATAQGTDTAGPAQGIAPPDQSGDIGDIVITAQRQSERLQDVPISVSAFTGAALETQQIHNSLDLQLSLPNITFTKTNFTASSFTIRGIGDLCTGFSCDQATGVHINDVPVPATRLFETEYLDLERVEVLRGPQGTLFGRNATSGVINFITARPDLSGIHAAGTAEYGNYDSKKVTGMFNLPLGETLGVRFAGVYLNRDGYTHNLYNDSDIDGRDLYQVRASIRWQPSSSTTIDLMGSYFHEKDDRSRIQKQLCHRDPTGILGCLPDRLTNETVNSNAVFQDLLTSREFLGIASATTPPAPGALAAFGVRSLYGPDGFAGSVNPADVRTVNSNVLPTYFSDEINVQGRIDQDVGDFSVSLIGGYNRARVDSVSGYFLNTPDSLATNVGLATFRGAAAAPGSPFAPGAAAIFNGGQLCTSYADTSYVGVFGGKTYGCSNQPLNYDRSRSTSEGWSGELHLNSHFDGMFNFLLGGIYLQGVTDGDYFVSPGLGSYAAAVLGYAKSVPAGLANSYLAPGFFNSETDRYKLKSYGIFGETYFEFSPKVKLTLGARYSHDEKFVRDRSPLLSVLVPYGAGITDAFASPYAVAYDADASTPGNQLYRQANVQFGRLTGRAVLDWKWRDDSLLYFSYSRGYKSGGINPPFDPSVFTAPATFRPESIDAFEIGSKNTFMNGALRLNLSAFYYRYKDLQLARILNKTSFNDNTDADIYGAEAEAVIRPDRHFMVNLTASYLKTKIKDFSLVDTRDPSGGRSDAVIIKDLQNANNCVIAAANGGTAAQANTFVSVVNQAALGLRGPTAIPGTNTTGAYSLCSTLAGLIANPNAAGAALGGAIRGLLGVPTGALPLQYFSDGIAVNLSGNQLPNAPMWKFSAGAQHTLELGGGMNLVSRADLTYTGEYYSRSFNRPIDKIQGYEIVNLSLQLNGADDRWFLRGFVQNLTANDAITGQYVTDPSTGLFTNVFTLEPRRYGAAIGFKF